MSQSNGIYRFRSVVAMELDADQAVLARNEIFKDRFESFKEKTFLKLKKHKLPLWKLHMDRVEGAKEFVTDWSVTLESGMDSSCLMV